MIPSSDMTVELWEESRWMYGLVENENLTWFVVRSEVNQEKWFLIDEYIKLTHVIVFISPDGTRVRIEDKRVGAPMPNIVNVAEYNFGTNAFRAVAEESVYGKEGWVVLQEKTIR